MDDDAFYLPPLEGFNRLADTYDTRLSGNPFLLLETTQTLAALPNLAGKSVGDIGCGTGRHALQLTRFGTRHVVGIDLSPEMLQHAQRKAQRADLALELGVGNLTQRLPLTDSVLDAAVCALTLSFVEDLRPAFRELARVLKRRGTLVVSERHPHSLLAERAASAAAFRKDKAPYLRFLDLEGRECRIPQHPHTFSDYIAAAHAAGLRLDSAAEPLVDHRLAVTHTSLKNQLGLPLALILRFTKESTPLAAARNPESPHE